MHPISAATAPQHDFARYVMTVIRHRAVAFQIFGLAGAVTFLMVLEQYGHRVPFGESGMVLTLMAGCIWLQHVIDSPRAFMAAQLGYVAGACLALRLGLDASDVAAGFALPAMLVASLIMATGFISYWELLLGNVIVLAILNPLARFSLPGSETGTLSYGLLATGLLGSVVVQLEQTRGLHKHCDLLGQLARQAYSDALTEIPNRRAFFELAERRLAEASAQPLFMAIVDIDHFKRINDTYGHEAGDQALKGTAQAIRRAMPDAVIGRLGGEEFGVLHAADDTRAARGALDRMARQIGGSGFKPQPVTVSIGFSAVGDKPLKQALRDADVALYRAKAGGRNQVQPFEPQPGAEPA